VWPDRITIRIYSLCGYFCVVYGRSMVRQKKVKEKETLALTRVSSDVIVCAANSLASHQCEF
jgi:hypothetical protein